MASLLDFLNTDEARMGLGLLAAGGYQPTPMSFGQRIQSAFQGEDARKMAELKKQSLLAQLEQDKLMNPLLLDSAKAQTEKTKADAAKSARINQFYSPESMQQFMTPGVTAVPSVPDEFGGGPSREAVAPALDFSKFLNAGVAAGVVEPEKVMTVQAQAAARREAALERDAARREKMEQQEFEAARRSEDRRYATDSTNERHRERLDFQRGADDRMRRGLLKPGERFNADGVIEVIPGSTEYVKRSNAHSKDNQVVAISDNKTDNAIKKIDQILAEDKDAVSAFNSNFGGYNAEFITQYVPGKTQDVRAVIDSLKSDLKTAGLDTIRAGGSIGAMTEREWPIVERMIANITPKLSEGEARKQLGEVRAHLERIKNISRNAYDTEWGGSQFHKNSKPVGAGGKTMTMADVAATARSRGLTERQVMDRAKAQGYEIK